MGQIKLIKYIFSSWTDIFLTVLSRVRATDCWRCYPGGVGHHEGVREAPVMIDEVNIKIKIYSYYNIIMKIILLYTWKRS